MLQSWQLNVERNTRSSLYGSISYRVCLQIFKVLLEMVLHPQRLQLRGAIEKRGDEQRVRNVLFARPLENERAEVGKRCREGQHRHRVIKAVHTELAQVGEQGSGVGEHQVQLRPDSYQWFR